MKTTVDIPDDVLQEALKHSGAQTKKDAILLALEEFNRRQRMARLADRLGTFDHFMTRRELDRMRQAGEATRHETR